MQGNANVLIGGSTQFQGNGAFFIMLACNMDILHDDIHGGTCGKAMIDKKRAILLGAAVIVVRII